VIIRVGGDTQKEPTANAPPESVAATVVLDVPSGTVNVQLNAPVSFVTKLPEMHTFERRETPPNVKSTASSRLNPAPEIVTTVPTGPCHGDTWIFGSTNLIASVSLAPLDKTEPTRGITTYPGTGMIAKAKVPYASLKVMDEPDEVVVTLFAQMVPLTVQFASPTTGLSCTDHEDSAARPDSVNMIG
jgi:hypothetical protein